MAQLLLQKIPQTGHSLKSLSNLLPRCIFFALTAIFLHSEKVWEFISVLNASLTLKFTVYFELFDNVS